MQFRKPKIEKPNLNLALCNFLHFEGMQSNPKLPTFRLIYVSIISRLGQNIVPKPRPEYIARTVWEIVYGGEV